MTQQTVENKLNELHTEEETLVIQFVIQEATKLLKRHTRLKEFVMCKGFWFFLDKNGSIIRSHPHIEDSNLADFIFRWDDRFNITWEPMRFTADGPVIRDWDWEDKKLSSFSGRTPIKYL